MSILVHERTNVIVQGITGRDGSFHAGNMLEYGTRVVAGVTPGKGGQKVDGIPVYDTVEECRANHAVDATVIFVPARFAGEAIKEAADARIPLIACITEGIPLMTTLSLYHYVRQMGVRLIGPNCPGLISPGKCKAGIMPAFIHKPGNIGVISRSGTLTYEVVYNLTKNDIGQSTCIGIGGDPVVGTSFVDTLALFQQDPDTQGVVLIGEIGGQEEEAAAEFIRKNLTKPAVSFISGLTAPKGKRMGHAGAIISGGKGTPEAKIEAFRTAGVPVAERPDEIPAILKKLIG